MLMSLRYIRMEMVMDVIIITMVFLWHCSSSTSVAAINHEKKNKKANCKQKRERRKKIP